jgi:hypothetical protein
MQLTRPEKMIDQKRIVAVDHNTTPSRSLSTSNHPYASILYQQTACDQGTDRHTLKQYPDWMQYALADELQRTIFWTRFQQPLLNPSTDQ